MTEQQPPYDGEPRKARPIGVSLYEIDIEEAERIRVHYDLDSISQAIRRAIRVTAAEIEQPKARIA